MTRIENYVIRADNEDVPTIISSCDTSEELKLMDERCQNDPAYIRGVVSITSVLI